MKTTKDVARGTANCDVLSETDDSHVQRVTPLMTKTRELRNDPQYQAINRTREKSTSRKRADKETKPL